MHQELLSKTEKCILKFKEVHGDRYNYDKLVYIKNSEKVIIICKEHGNFLQTPASHKQGKGCPKCGRKKGKTQKSTIKEFKEVHGERYIYDKMIYIKYSEKVIITCKEHGDFLQTPSNHSLGQGCLECGKLKKSRLTQEQVINDFTKIHGNRYNYSKVNYKNGKEKIIINCKKHGDFLQTPANHKKGVNCPKCVLENKQNTEGIIKIFEKVHGDRYNYDKVIYVNQKEKVIINCRKHGDFLQTPANHRSGNDCPKCRVYHSYYRDREYYKGKKTILYHIFLPEYNLYKIGLTISSVKQRFKYDKGIKYDILSEEVFNDGALAFDKEQDILDKTRKYEYLGEKILENGNTEIRTNKII